MKRYMHLMSDYAFKKIFGSEENKSILIKFLNAVIPNEDKIIDVIFRDKEALPFQEDGKRMVYDIYCLTHDGRHIVVEMQRAFQPTFSDRALLYSSHLLLRQLRSGNAYEVAPVYGIFLMGFNMIDQTPALCRRVSLMDEDRHELFSNKLKLIFLDLKEMTKNSLEECLNPIEEWLFLIKNMENMKDKPNNYPTYDELFEAADLSSMANEDVVSYSQSRRKMQDDMEGMAYFGRMQREEGREEGRLSTLIEKAKQAKEMGLPDDIIKSLFGL